MYQLLVLFTGIIISVMITANGDLTQSFGLYYAAVIIHIVGVLFAYFLCLLKKENVRKKVNVPFWAYLGGAIGVLTTLFNSYAYTRISMTSIVALGLLGQSVTSTLIDAFGLFGVKKRPIEITTWVGFGLSCIGVVIMMDDTVTDGIAAIIVSIATGVTVVMARTVNARLSIEKGAFVGSFYNHLVGLPICILIALLLSTTQSITLHTVTPWMFLGGTLGVLVVALYNITIPKVSSFRVTLLSFLGQVFSSIVIDLVYGQSVSGKLFWGGIVITIGLLASMILDYLGEKKIEKIPDVS